MNKIYKFAGAIGAIGTGLLAMAHSAGAQIITLPTYSDLINPTTTAFGGSFLADLLPIAGYLAIITIIGMVLAAVIRRVLGGIGKIAGGRRRGGRGRRRR